MTANATVSPAAAAAWNDYVREVKDRMADAALGVIGADTKLVACGRGQWKGLSPFRKEKTPSFYLYGDGGWYDYGTQEGGDLLSYVQKRDGGTFREAVDALAAAVGVATWDERKKILGGSGTVLDEDALHELWHSQADKRKVFEAITALVHLCHAGLPTQVREHLRNHYALPSWFIDFEKIGWVPDGLWDLAKECLSYDEETLLATGFFARVGDEVGPKSTLSQRILFPYWKDGVCVYTIGREFFGKAGRAAATLPEWDKAKYKKHPTHSKEKRPYVSSWIENSVLWGEDNLRGSRGERVLITEGITDAYMLKILGYRVISPVTTSFRTQDAQRAAQMLRSASEVVILNDADILPDGRQPGLEGAKRMALELFAAGIPVRIARLPRPEGVDKTDVNELGQRALFGDDLTLPEDDWHEKEARAFFDAIIAKASNTLQFMIDEIPAEASLDVIETALVDIGKLAASLSDLQRLDLFDRLHKRFPKLPRKPAQTAFINAARTEAKEQKEAKARGEQAGTSGNGAPAGNGAGGGGNPNSPAARGKMRGSVIEEIGSYERELPNGDTERISSFGLTLRRVVRPLHGTAEHLVCEVTGMDGTTVAPAWVVPPGAWGGKRAFIAHFPTTEMQWGGADEEVQGVLETLTKEGGLRKVPNVRSVTAIGRHDMPDGSPRFVLPSGTMSKEGWMAEPDLVYLPDGGSNLQHRLPEGNTDLDAGRDTLAKAWIDLFSVQDTNAIVPMVAWSLATYFAPMIRSRLRGFPLLNVAATMGSGKTSLVASILWPLFVGVTAGEPLACTSTLFAYTRDFSSTNSLFLILDEYKPADMQDRSADVLHRLLRRLYAGDTETRGRQDQDVNVYYLRACVALLGEVRLDHDPALSERSIYVPLSKNWVETNVAGREAFKRLARLPLFLVAPFLQRWSLCLDGEAMLEAARVEADAALVGMSLAERVRNNLTTMVFGLGLLRALATEVGMPLPTMPETGALLRRLLVEILDEDPDDVVSKVSNGGRATDSIDALLVEASAAAHLGVLREGKHYAKTDGGNIALWLTGILYTLNEQRSKRRDRPFPLNEKALCRIAREKLTAGSTYVVEVRARIAIEPGGTRLRCLVINEKNIPHKVGCDPFPFPKSSDFSSVKPDWGAAAARAGFSQNKPD